MSIPCQRNESESPKKKAEDEGNNDPASRLANVIAAGRFVRKEATPASIHYGRRMATASLTAFVATHI